MMMGLWFILLVNFVILMMVIGYWRRNEGEAEEVGSGTYHAEEEEENWKKTKEDPHSYGNVSQGREEVEGVEPLNLVSLIVKIHTQVHIPV